METTPGIFDRRFRETVAWSQTRTISPPTKWSLRSIVLVPQADFDDPNDPTFWNDTPLIEYVVEKRSELLQASGWTIPSSDPTASGRLLVCDYSATNHNYGSAEASNWFFDGYDNPPWDIWVCEVGETLVSWVPNEYVALATEGIAVECIGMLSWMEDAVRNPERWELPHWLVRRAQIAGAV